MYSKVLTAAAAVLFSFAAAAAQTAPVPVSAPVNDPVRGYTIGPGDEITGKVLGEEQFDFVATVDANGKIEVPFFDRPVTAQCRTEPELRADVARLLSKYLKSPQLSLRVTQRNSRPPVSVYGEVRQQQQLIMTRRARLLELIAAAGGVTEKSGGMIQVFRTRPPMCAETFTDASWTTASAEGLNVPSRLYSLAALRQGGEDANPEILPGDIIVVQKASPIYVTGEVVHPGELNIPEGGLPLTQAVAMASGITREAKTKTIKVYRRKAGTSQPQVIVANYDSIKKGQEKDVMLEPFDIVEVDKAKKSIGDILLETLTGLPGRIPIPIRPL
jgi:protein involved in polysaccharide export with SLBB domain